MNGWSVNVSAGNAFCGREKRVDHAHVPPSPFAFVPESGPGSHLLSLWTVTGCGPALNLKGFDANQLFFSAINRAVVCV